jgi:hypothetical protein
MYREYETGELVQQEQSSIRKGPKQEEEKEESLYLKQEQAVN